MPPKGKEVKKGAVSGNYKAGKALKDILPANSKAPREGNIARMEGDSEVHRTYEFEPLEMLPEWPGNEAALGHDFKAGFEQSEDGHWSKFTEPEAVKGVGELNLPPSFNDFTKSAPVWMRPEEYIKEIMFEKEVYRRRQEKKREFKLRKSTRKNTLMALASNGTAEDAEKMKQEISELEQLKKTSHSVIKDELIPMPKVIASEERLETDAEVHKRKELAEKAAAADKGAKKKAPPAKGAPVADPADEPQSVKIAIDGCLDMSFLMPKYTKWVTSQFQFIRDRTIRDVDSNEAIWQRIYPQENGIPTISPTGKYWIKLRFMGKERLVEIDDRMPCSHNRMPILPRTTDVNEIWPQLLMKALLKVYSYKWYSANCQYDSEIGDGSLVYSLTGLIPEKIQIQNLDQAKELFRHYLSDDQYFGKKSFVTAYCENEFRPKFPSQNTLSLKSIGMPSPSLGKPSGFGDVAQKAQVGSTFHGDITDGFSETASIVSSSSKIMLNKLKEAASLAISVTTGRKPAFGAKEKSLTNIIPGFGYALMDVFENEFVEMESIQKLGNKQQIEEENSSPFASPSKSRTKRDKSVGKDEHKKNRKEQRKKDLEEYEKKERTPPTQYAFVKIKTSIGKHPVINYLSTFTNDEIQEGKKHLINKWRRDPSKAVISPLRSPSPKRREYGSAGKFKIDINQVVPNQDEGELLTSSKLNKLADTSNASHPKTRAAGGIWLTQSDFPFAFQNIVIYHNIKKYTHNTYHMDTWSNCAEPYISNEKEVYFKLELDEEAIQKCKQEQIDNKNIGVIRRKNLEGEEGEEVKDPAEGIETERSVPALLPGEREKLKSQLDDIVMACAPYPTNKRHEVLPRYLTNIQQVDCQVEQAKEQKLTINQNFKSYFEGVKFKVIDNMSDQKCIWLKPEFNCPQGSAIWIASQIRKISVLSKVEYLQDQKKFYAKQVTCDYLPQQAGKYQLFAKFEFNIHDDDTLLNIKVDAPSDKYLLDYMRLKIVDRSSTTDFKTETSNAVILNQMNVSDLKLNPNDYYLIVEGVMPYNSADGQLVIDTLCNKDGFALNEVVSCEPQEYVDSYVPTKYGIIFKEKIVISPMDNTSAAINVKLLKGGKEFSQVEGMKPKYFKVDVLDNGKKVFSQNGYNQITMSHIMFRCNNGLAESLEEGAAPETEIKHNYVIQALFDLHEWPEGKSVCDDSSDITWQIKVYSSETLALIKDTDKEDKEKALKSSWETDEPGRAEKAQVSRQKFILKQKQKNGETLTEEELAIIHEKRERVRKKDQEDVAAKGAKGGKGAPPAKGGKVAPPAKGAPVAVEEEDEKSKIHYPLAENHVNNEIKDFLDHFASSRKIILDAKQSRERDDTERQSILDSFSSAQTAESENFQQISKERDTMKEGRQKEREEAFKDMDEFRNNYKTDMQSLITSDREKYRGMIDGRKEKETALLDMIRSDKADIAALTAAIEAAKDLMVKPKYIQKGKKFLKFMEYVREFEGMITQAVADKNKEALQGLLERVETESTMMGSPIPIDVKILNDAKGNLAKMK